MRFSVLGTLAVHDDGGLEIPIRGTLQRRLLGLLLSHAGGVASTDSLIGALWNGVPPPSAGKTLQSHIVRLRDTVDPGRRLLETRPPGYVLRADRESLDAIQFQRLVMLARHASAADVPDSAAAMLADALALWRGTAYADLCDCESLAREAARLDELRQDALEERVEADLACGRGPDLVQELQAGVQTHPFRERRWRQLAVALYRSGRQADALEALRRVRTALREELGVDPGPELRAVEEAILRQDPALHQVGMKERARSQLPPALTADTWPLVGRQSELGWLLEAWTRAARSRGGVVLVRGPAGIGRSRLLAEFARDVAARGVKVCFASGRAKGDVVAHALSPGGAESSLAVDTASVLAHLERAAVQAPTLIVLDDLHLSQHGLASLTAAAGVARDLPLLIAVSYNVDGGIARTGRPGRAARPRR